MITVITIILVMPWFSAIAVIYGSYNLSESNSEFGGNKQINLAPWFFYFFKVYHDFADLLPWLSYSPTNN